MPAESQIQILPKDDALGRCQERLGYAFTDRRLLKAALTHASGAAHRLDSNERLEFLGDAILGLVVCELLYQTFEKYEEGELTKVKSVVVSRQTCAAISRALALEEFIVVGKGMAGGQRLPVSLMAGVFESLVAAIYLDGGLVAAREFILRHVRPVVDSTVEGSHGANYKSLLQQIGQKEYNATPTYSLLDEKGPDHSKCFLVSAHLGSKKFSPAWGRNKKEAEQHAALNALNELNGQPPTYAAH
jgi:ribonuclease-3